MLWGLPGRVSKGTESIAAETPSGTLEVYLCGPDSELGSAWTRGAYFASSLAGPVAVSTGRRRSLGEAQAAVLRGEARYRASLGAHGASAEIMGAIETVLGWDTIYDPTKARVITPVSRVWNVGWGGYVLFDWDTFFAAEMAAVDDRDLAYANVLEMLAEATSAGFIPNFARSRGLRSEDRSEPPVGSRVTLDLFRRYHDRWMVEEAFPALLAWNRWWAAHRDRDGYLVWGSSAPEPGARPMDPSAHTLQGAKFESGLDNSPMYDGAAFDEATGQMEFADVGLMSLYVDDCGALATLADALGRSAEAAEIRERGSRYQAKLRGLWSEKDGIFLNRDLRTGAPSLRLSPTNFYPMLSGTATPEQARRMVAAHLMNPAEFWGEWVIPSIARNDPAFKDQDYWRGRIWGPMNYLVYLGLRNYDLPEARRALADRSAALFVREWRTKGHISENYDGATGSSDIEASDRFYHWGALLGLIKVEEDSGPPPPPIQAPADPSQ
jgi:glycogen debranching enzyme